MISFYLLLIWMANLKKKAKKNSTSGRSRNLICTFKPRNSKQDKTFTSANSFMFTPSPGSFEILVIPTKNPATKLNSIQAKTSLTKVRP